MHRAWANNPYGIIFVTVPVTGSGALEDRPDRNPCIFLSTRITEPSNNNHLPPPGLRNSVLLRKVVHDFRALCNEGRYLNSTSIFSTSLEICPSVNRRTSGPGKLSTEQESGFKNLFSDTREPLSAMCGGGGRRVRRDRGACSPRCDDFSFVKYMSSTGVCNVRPALIRALYTNYILTARSPLRKYGDNGIKA